MKERMNVFIKISEFIFKNLVVPDLPAIYELIEKQWAKLVLLCLLIDNVVLCLLIDKV